jgi:hypothetical protein
MVAVICWKTEIATIELPRRAKLLTSARQPGRDKQKRKHIMNTTHNTKTRLLRLAATAVATPALLFTGAGTALFTGAGAAQADNCEGILGAVFGSINDCLGPYYSPQHPLQPTSPINGPEANFPRGANFPMNVLPQDTGGPGDLLPGWEREGRFAPPQPQTTTGPYTGPSPAPEPENPYCSPAFWPNNLPSEGTGNPCEP